VVEVLTRHIGEAPRSLCGLRPEVPAAIDGVVQRALAKDREDRYADAAAFAAALARAHAGAATPPASESVPGATGRRRWFIGGVALVVLLGAVAVAARLRTSAPVSSADVGAIAVLPFRVGGADPALAYLREGMLDLLATKLSADGLPAAVDPRAVMGAARARAGGADTDLAAGEARELARGLGAGRVLVGSVVGTPQRLVISASLEPLDGIGTPSLAEVEGSIDSLPRLVDRLAAQLLALGAGESSQRLEAVTSTSLAALRDYLSGRALYRRGRYAEAVEHFRGALATDSTFALAALGWRLAAGWTGSDDIATSAARTHALRDRLPARDRVVLAALVGPRYPGYSSEREVLDAWRRATDAAPDLPEAWYEYGDQYYHAGALLGIVDAEQRAREAFRRALAIDPDFAPAIVHLVEIAARTGDTVRARALGAQYTARDSASETADFIRWRVAQATGDSAGVRALRARMATLSPESLRRIVVAMQLDGIPGDDAERAAAGWLAAHRAPDLRWFALLRVHDLRLNRGDAVGALVITDSLRLERPGSRAWLRVRVEDALYGGGDATAGARAAAALAPRADAPLSGDADERAEQYADACTVWQWRLAARPVAVPAARAAIARLRSATTTADGVESTVQNAWCAIALEALLNPAGLPRLDSLLVSGPRPMETSRSRRFRTFMMGNILAARLQLRQGDQAAALAAIRRRPVHGAGTVHLRSTLLLERELAARLGDTLGARAAARRLAALERPGG
jgi:tetratricopeptide (TPR) repeat protein